MHLVAVFDRYDAMVQLSKQVALVLTQGNTHLLFIRGCGPFTRIANKALKAHASAIGDVAGSIETPRVAGDDLVLTEVTCKVAFTVAYPIVTLSFDTPQIAIFMFTLIAKVVFLADTSGCLLLVINLRVDGNFTFCVLVNGAVEVFASGRVALGASPTSLAVTTTNRGLLVCETVSAVIAIVRTFDAAGLPKPLIFTDTVAAVSVIITDSTRSMLRAGVGADSDIA